LTLSARVVVLSRAEVEKQRLYERLGGCGPAELAASLKDMWAKVQATAKEA
jgi:hypothetical protein